MLHWAKLVNKMSELIEVYNEYPTLADFDRGGIATLFISLTLVNMPEDANMIKKCQEILKHKEIDIEFCRREFLKNTE